MSATTDDMEKRYDDLYEAWDVLDLTVGFVVHVLESGDQSMIDELLEPERLHALLKGALGERVEL